MNKLLSIGRAFFIVLAMGLFITSKAIASDNVLQAIQVNGVKDSFSIVLKSDDTADFKKTVQAPNKIIVDLKGIRASKTINTIYNNTSGIDSVVVEPDGQDAVKIFVQGENASNAEVHFDTLKTPLGVLDNSEAKKQSESIVLSEPMDTYKPVYNQTEEKENNFSVSNIMKGSTVSYLKKLLKNEKLSWMITFALVAMVILSSTRTNKSRENDIKVGLAQSLKEREIELYKEMVAKNAPAAVPSMSGLENNPAKQSIAPQQVAGAYGIKAYQQNESRNPYVSSEIQRPRPMSAPRVNAAPVKNNGLTAQNAPQRIVSNAGQQVSTKIAQNIVTNSVKPKVANIDSMKFLESMTKIYEKNGRTDLAQGLKSNMKKAKLNLA